MAGTDESQENQGGADPPKGDTSHFIFSKTPVFNMLGNMQWIKFLQNQVSMAPGM